MTELKITRGKDVELYADEEILFGVTEFVATGERKVKEIYEYLSGEPCATIENAPEYEIRLSVMSLFNYAVFDRERFTISVVDGDVCYVYEDCVAVRRERKVKASEPVCDSYHIKAKRMVKRVTDDAE